MSMRVLRLQYSSTLSGEFGFRTPFGWILNASRVPGAPLGRVPGASRVPGAPLGRVPGASLVPGASRVPGAPLGWVPGASRVPGASLVPGASRVPGAPLGRVPGASLVSSALVVPDATAGLVSGASLAFINRGDVFLVFDTSIVSRKNRGFQVQHWGGFQALRRFQVLWSFQRYCEAGFRCPLAFINRGDVFLVFDTSIV